MIDNVNEIVKGEVVKMSVGRYLNIKDIKTRQDQINKELLEVDDKIKKLLDKRKLLVSRGVQDESLLKEHLE